MEVIWKGLVPYEEGLKIQAELSEKTRIDRVTRLIGLEHPMVITLGKRGNPIEDLQHSATNAPVVITDRGGQATLHSPGQLVIYPIVHLQEKGMGVRDFVHHLEEATIETLMTYGIQTSRGEASGVFTEKGKIAFVGIRVDRGVSRHGISINISNDLALFDLIRPCGVSHQKMDRVVNHQDVKIEDFYTRWSQFMTRV